MRSQHTPNPNGVILSHSTLTRLRGFAHFTQKVYKPAEHHKLSTLRHIYSTGSPLAPHLFDFVYEHISPNVLLGSITGEFSPPF